MKFSDFIVKEATVPELQASDRDGVLKELVGALAASGAITRDMVDEIVTEVIKREKKGSTGFGKGVAVPHAKYAKIEKMVGAVGRSTRGVDFAALDKQPVYSVFLLLSPESQPQQHLQAMSLVFDNLQRDTFRRFLRQSTTREAIADLLEETDSGGKA